ncbi:MAG TPA: translation initiation factor IF-1 [Haliangiales bacterium]|nr:translation initiation factor IF-1 [Haliangiales bacterium]
MPREDAIKIEGTVVEVLQDILFRVELPNRHRLLAYTAGKARAKRVRFAPGDKVTVEMSPYDLSKGRITAENQIIET